MKSLTKDFLKTTIAVSLAFVFAIGLSVVNAGWTAPQSSPPTCNVNDPGCDTPLNVSSFFQKKTGALEIGGGLAITNGNLYLKGTTTIAGGSPGIGKVLTSVDASGNAEWRVVAVASSVPSGTWCGSGYVEEDLTGQCSPRRNIIQKASCQGLNPAADSNSCPSSYTKTNIAISAIGEQCSNDPVQAYRNTYYTCIKN